MRKHLLCGALALGLAAGAAAFIPGTGGLYAWAQGFVTVTSLNATDLVEIRQATGAQHQYTALSTMADALRGYGSVVVPVVRGGTGAATLTDHGVLLGSGTDPVSAAAVGTTGQMLLGVTGADPAFGNNPVITGGTINGAAIGGTVTAAGAFTTLASSGAYTPTGGVAAAGGFSASPRNVATCGGGGRNAAGALTDQTPVSTEVYIAEVFVPANMTVTGVAVFNGTAVSGNMKVGLANSAGAVVATSASTAASGTDAYQRVPFTGTYAAVGPATYYVLTFYDNNTQRANALKMGNCGAAKQTGQVFATGFTTITPPTTFTADLGPAAALY